MPKQIATWDGQKDCWIAEPTSRSPRKKKITRLEHWGVYSETLPKWGTMRGGVLFEQEASEVLTSITSEHHTSEHEFSLLPTPAVNDMGAAYDPQSWDEWTAKQKAAHNNGNGHGNSLNVEVQKMLPTPNTMDSLPPRYGEAYEKAKLHGDGNPRASSGNLREVVVHDLLPSPTSRDYKDNEIATNPNRPNDRDTLSRALTEVNLLRTPCAQEAGGGPCHPEVAAANNQTLRLTGHLAAPDGSFTYNWNQYEGAIKRWEYVTGVEAPCPVEQTEKGKFRLNSAFAEWMMGWAKGWVTGRGLPRTQELKIIGNGVVTQQAKYAITTLLKLGQANDTTGM